MKIDESLKKQELIQKIGLDFKEVAFLFSEETLQSMLMTQIVGGGDSFGGASCAFPDICTHDACSHSNCSHGGTCTDSGSCTSGTVKPTAKPTSKPTPAHSFIVCGWA